MKKEILNSLRILNSSLEKVNATGRESVLNMRDAFIVLDGIYDYVNKLPEEEPQEEVE